MANKKVTDLAEITTASVDDLLYLIDAPGSSPASRKITKANFLKEYLLLAGGSVTGDISSTADIILGSGGAIYLGSKDTDGSWRFIRSGDDLSIQRLEASVWVEKASITA